MISIKLTVPAEEEITNDGIRIIIEKKVKHQGVWFFHLSDEDTWPSIPHGINNEKSEKLNLFTGQLYSIKTRNQIGQLNKKSMRFILKELAKSKDSRIYDKIMAKKEEINYLKGGRL